jgi:hypothetical protein
MPTTMSPIVVGLNFGSAGQFAEDTGETVVASKFCSAKENVILSISTKRYSFQELAAGF